MIRYRGDPLGTGEVTEAADDIGDGARGVDGATGAGQAGQALGGNGSKYGVEALSAAEPVSVLL